VGLRLRNPSVSHIPENHRLQNMMGIGAWRLNPSYGFLNDLNDLRFKPFRELHRAQRLNDVQTRRAQRGEKAADQTHQQREAQGVGNDRRR
jgi:hypothetical protein